MASDFSFDIVCNTDIQEVKNAINQATKELTQRFDFKGSKSEINLQENTITVISDDEYKLKSVIDILQTKMVKRNISLKALKYNKVEQALGNTARQTIEIQQGIAADKAKELVKQIKQSKAKVQAQIQDDQVRVTSKSKDSLQEIITLVKSLDLGIDLQFINYRN